MQAERLFEMEDERPLCRCHGLPMNKYGRYPATSGKRLHGTQRWRCVVADRAVQREKNTRRVRIHVGDSTLHLGYMPTPELAQQLRQLIKEEAPRARRQRT